MVTTWDESTAERVVGRLVQRKASLFKCLPTYDRDDLLSEGLMAARKAWPKYDPDKAAASTFIYLAASRRIIDLWRKATREAARDQGWAERHHETVYPDEPKAETLVEWLEDAYHIIQRTVRTYSMGSATGVEAIDRAQAAALLALQRHMRMDGVMLSAFLATQPHLLDVLGLERVPDAETIAKLARCFPAFSFAAA